MMFFDELYQKSVEENDKNLKFWENYLDGLKKLNFDVYANKLKVPILVPIGNKILFRGEVRHTNEVTVSLGADYFVKCSIAQAEVLRKRRIEDAQSAVDVYIKEKQNLENRISFTKELFATEGQEILEEYSEQEDKAWREKHRENVKKYKQSKVVVESKPINDSDSELWERLEELELQEELESELLDNYNEIVDNRKKNTFLQKEEQLLRNSFKEKKNNQLYEETATVHQQQGNIDGKNDNENSEINSIMKPVTDGKNTDEISKHELLQKVIDKQIELENKLHELKHKEKQESKTEQDLIAQLDEIDRLNELEDELERLEDLLKTEDVETDEDASESNGNSTKSDSNQLKKSISFADDEDDAETLEIEFSHTDTEPNKDPYNPQIGITKPSDVYEVHSHLFDNKKKSILKKSKYAPIEGNVTLSTETRRARFAESIETLKSSEQDEVPAERTIVVRDVVENVGVNQHHIEGGARPTSLFKKKRMQKK